MPAMYTLNIMQYALKFSYDCSVESKQKQITTETVNMRKKTAEFNLN